MQCTRPLGFSHPGLHPLRRIFFHQSKTKLWALASLLPGPCLQVLRGLLGLMMIYGFSAGRNIHFMHFCWLNQLHGTVGYGRIWLAIKLTRFLLLFKSVHFVSVLLHTHHNSPHPLSKASWS
jgi:hypothetical protein